MTPPIKLLPVIYLDADVRNVTPVCPGRKRLGLGLDIPGQPTVRVAITLAHARFLRDSLDAEGIAPCAALKHMADGATVRCAASCVSERRAAGPRNQARAPASGALPTWACRPGRPSWCQSASRRRWRRSNR